MTTSFDLFWSFRSPYSYLAAQRLRSLVRRLDVACRFRPVRPLAVREPDFFKRVHRGRLLYILSDSAREAERLGLPFHWPQPDPIVQDLETLTIAPEQPLIMRVTRLGVAAAEQGDGLAFAAEASAIIFGGVQGWDTGDHLATAAARAGLEWSTLERVAANEAARLDAVIAENEAAQSESGHSGVPLMVLEGETFFGQDRVDALEWRLRQRGVADR